MSQLDGRGIKDFWVQETPSGTINGVNTSFTLSQTPKEDECVMIFLAGLLVTQDVGYTISGTAITFATAPAISSVLRAIYVRKTGS